MIDQWGIESVYVVTSDYGDCINGVFSSMENAVAYVNKRVVEIPGLGIRDYVITERIVDSGSGGCIVDDVTNTPDTFYTPLKGAKLEDVIKQANTHFNDVTKGLLFQIVATIKPRVDEPEGMGNRGVMKTWIKVNQKKD